MTKPPTATIQPITNTPSIKAIIQEASVPAPATPVSTRTRTKTTETTETTKTTKTTTTMAPTFTTAPTSTKVPTAPKVTSTITKSQHKVLDNNPETASSAPSLPQAIKVMKKKRTKTVMTEKSVNSSNHTDESDQDTVKKPAKKKVQQCQGPNGSTVHHLAMHQKEQDQTSLLIPPGMTQPNAQVPAECEK
ncbi:hypothetical protein BG006_008963 [Podila minutissima]|uniref:Uncharacterized protein n=1 Tax=Podila minutissima TaxID=64525 RepID=A0A9P5SRP6_9FUNG|nr:hypothetical protein BG006_008963 [Podila minutissima]